MGAVIKGIVAAVLGLWGLAGCTGGPSTDLQTGARILQPCSVLPNCVSSVDDDAVHRIAPLSFSGDPIAAFSRLESVLSQRRDTTVVEQLPGYLRVEYHTTLFTDDGEFLLDPNQNLIQVRSASRLGLTDLGKNRSRLEDIRRQFSAAEGQ